MDFIKQYVKYNDFFRKKLMANIQYCKEHPNFDNSNFLSQLEDPSIDLEGTIYKLLADESEIVNLSSESYELLPVGLINKNVPAIFIDDLPDENKPNVTRNGFRKLLFTEPNYNIFYYSNDKKNSMDENSAILSIDSSFKQICESYIEHYRESLDENWSEKDFYEMLKNLKYLTIKYARNVDTKELIVIGFFGAFVRNGVGGRALTNAELYVMPEFRGMGIAKRLVGVSFSKAKMDGIENFDSITYRTPSMNALKFWESIGANVSGLYHIEGTIPEMMEKINNKTRNV